MRAELNSAEYYFNAEGGLATLELRVFCCLDPLQKVNNEKTISTTYSTRVSRAIYQRRTETNFSF